MHQVYLGAHGQTIFTLRPSQHIGGTKIKLQTRDGSVLIGRREIQIITGLAEIFGVECDRETIASLTDKLDGTQMKDAPITQHEKCSNPSCIRYTPGHKPLCSSCKAEFGS